MDCPASVDNLENGNPDAVHHSDSELSADRIQLQVVAILQLLGARDRLLIIFTVTTAPARTALRAGGGLSLAKALSSRGTRATVMARSRVCAGRAASAVLPCPQALTRPIARFAERRSACGPQVRPRPGSRSVCPRIAPPRRLRRELTDKAQQQASARDVLVPLNTSNSG